MAFKFNHFFSLRLNLSWLYMSVQLKQICNKTVITIILCLLHYRLPSNRPFEFSMAMQFKCFQFLPNRAPHLNFNSFELACRFFFISFSVARCLMRCKRAIVACVWFIIYRFDLWFLIFNYSPGWKFIYI